MPLYSEHISNMYYGGSPSYSGSSYSYGSSVSPLGSSYSASYLNPGGSYSSHSSLGGYSRAPLSSRWISSAGRNYSPILSTISERGTASPIRLNSPRRIPISKRTYGTPAYTPRPININTADIDVSKDKYRHKSGSLPLVSPKTSPKKEVPKNEEVNKNNIEKENVEKENVDKENGPFMPRVDGKPETGIDSSPGSQRSTIKRGRTVVRLHTIKRRERDSPRKSTEEPEFQDAVSNEVSVDTASTNETETQEENTENLTWREKLSDDLIYKGKKEKKSLGTKMVEKHKIKDEDDVSLNASQTTASTKEPVIENKQTLLETPLPDVSNIDPRKSPDRRCSMELLAEQASLFDSLIRRENLSTTSLDLSKVGISDNSTEKVENSQSVKKRKGSDSNPLKTTKSDHSLHDSFKANQDRKDTRSFSKRKSLRRSSSGSSICRLDSITEFPKESCRTELSSIEEYRASIKKENNKAKPKLKQVITSSVEVSPPKSPLKFKVENVTVEEIACAPKKEITYSSSIEEVPVENEVNMNIPQRNTKNRRSVKKKSKLTNTNTKNENEMVSPEPDEGNFWDKIGKRETIYLLRRRQNIDDARERNRRALFWYPEDEEANDEKILNNFNSEGKAHGSLLTCDILGPIDDEEGKAILNTDESLDEPESNTQDFGRYSSTNVESNENTNTIKSDNLMTKNEVITRPEAPEEKPIEEKCTQLSITDKLATNEVKTVQKQPIKEESSLIIDGSDISGKNDNKNNKSLARPVADLATKSAVTTEKLIPNRNMPSLVREESTKMLQVTSNEKNTALQKPDAVVSVESLEKTESLTSQLQLEKPKEIITVNATKPEVNANKILDNHISHPPKETPKSITIERNAIVPEKESLKSQIQLEKPKESIEINASTPEANVNEIRQKDFSKPPKEIPFKSINVESNAVVPEKEALKSQMQLEKPKESITINASKSEANVNIIPEKVTLNSPKETPSKANIIQQPEKLNTRMKSTEEVEVPKPSLNPSNLKLEKKEEVQQKNTIKTDTCSNVISEKPGPLKTVPKKPNLKDTKTGPQKLSALAKSAKTCDKVEAPKCSPLKSGKKIDSPSENKIQGVGGTSSKEVEDSKSKNKFESQACNSNSIITLNESDNKCPKCGNESKVQSVTETSVVENIPDNKSELKTEVLVEQANSGEDNKAENILKTEEKKVENEKPVPIVAKPIASPRKPVKEEAAIRPLIATPRPLQKKVPQVIHSSSSSESSSEESSEDEDTDESDSSEGSTEFYECENNPDGRTSTGSNDSGFDSSAPTSPAGFVQIKKGGEIPGTSGAAQAQDAVGVLEQELEQSTAYGLFRKTGRFTPPARSIPRFRKYAIDDFHFIKVLGKGSFGKVLLAELRDTEYYYAVKCLKKDVVLEDDDVECTLIERKVLALGTNHPYLCHLFATFQTDSHLFFVMEYLNGGDLMFHIQQSGRFPESRARFYAAEIVSGLKFLHKRGIVYRDLKLDNILLDFDGHVRIADFGMCKLQIYLEKTADTFCGTPDYMAPEIIKGLKYNQAVDWWSFGVLLYEMLIGQSPFSGCDEDELFWSICNEMPSYPRFLSQDALTILTRLLDKDARTRLGGAECMHGDVRDQEFFRGVHWDRLERRELDAPFKPRVRHPLDTQYFDRAFTGERPRLTAVEPHVLRSMDQEPFRGFSYTNPNATDR